MATDEELIEGLRKGVELGEWVEIPRIPQPQGTLWVCTTCMLAREAGTQEACCEGWWRDECACPVPWNREPDTDVTAGILEHDSRCTEEDREEGCDCSEIDFSARDCDACGNPLAGTRHAYTWWE